MNVDTLRAKLSEWGAANGASLKLGTELPMSWLAPLAYTDADPLEATGDDDGASDGGGPKTLDDTVGDDEFGGGADDDYDDDDMGRSKEVDVIVGKGTEPVRKGIALDTFVHAISVFSLKNGEMRAQL